MGFESDEHIMYHAGKVARSDMYSNDFLNENYQFKNSKYKFINFSPFDLSYEDIKWTYKKGKCIFNFPSLTNRSAWDTGTMQLQLTLWSVRQYLNTVTGNFLSRGGTVAKAIIKNIPSGATVQPFTVTTNILENLPSDEYSIFITLVSYIQDLKGCNCFKNDIWSSESNNKFTNNGKLNQPTIIWKKEHFLFGPYLRKFGEFLLTKVKNIPWKIKKHLKKIWPLLILLIIAFFLYQFDILSF